MFFADSACLFLSGSADLCWVCYGDTSFAAAAGVVVMVGVVVVVSGGARWPCSNACGGAMVILAWRQSNAGTAPTGYAAESCAGLQAIVLTYPCFYAAVRVSDIHRSWGVCGENFSRISLKLVSGGYRYSSIKCLKRVP